MAHQRLGVPTSLVLTLALGTVLNPLNSSMIAIALTSLQREFGVGIATSTWMASAFYLTAAVGQPLMGRLADQLGARRLFLSGLTLMGVASALAPFAPGYWWLVGVRVAQAVATSTAFPCAHILIRAATTVRGGTPAGALATLSVAGATSAALGPVLGGLLIAAAGWPAVFLVNVPLTMLGILIAWGVLPSRPVVERSPSWWATLDLPGIGLFTTALAALMVFGLSLADRPLWWLVPIVGCFSAFLAWRELSVSEPFLDLRGIVGNRALSVVLLQQGGVNLVFYCVFFGLPMWLEQVRGYSPDLVGFLVLPVTVVGVLATPLTARAIRRHGSITVLVIGFSLLLTATVGIQLLDNTTPIVLLVAVAALLGLPNGVNNLSLQTALYDATPPERAGASAGLFQTFRYFGAISATSVLGVVLEQDPTSRGLHHVGFVMTAMAALLLVLALTLVRRRG